MCSVYPLLFFHYLIHGNRSTFWMDAAHERRNDIARRIDGTHKKAVKAPHCSMRLVMEKRRLTPKQRLVFPLDLPDWKSAKVYVEKLKDSVGFFKVGLELFISEGPAAVHELKSMLKPLEEGGAGIFLDLKLHDIPATVGRAAASASRLGADLLTIHAAGKEMVAAAKASAGNTKILAVTVLTSLDLSEPLGLAEKYREPLNLVLLRAEQSHQAGCDGFVCSGREAKAVRELTGDSPWIITPGIRPEWSLVSGDDQKRVVTPAKAIGDGSDLLVVGRPIRDASNPAQAADRVVAEIEAAL